MSSDVKDAAVKYAHLGFSVIPVKANKKPLTYTSRGQLLPGGGWKFAQEKATDPKTVESWFRQAPGAGVAIVCGRVSGNIVVLDVDYRVLVDWLKENAWNLLSSTWVVQTGSGRLHIYLRSTKQCFSAGINAGSIHIAEIRADGTPPNEASYVVAPPSPYDFKGITGSYKTLAGSPDKIAEVDDASEFFRVLLMKSGGMLNGSSPGVMTIQSDAVVAATTAIAPAGAADELADVIRSSGVSPKIVRAITRGAKYGEGDWENAPSNSEIDYAVVIALREVGISDETVEQVFATFPIGEACYRNTDRPNHGHRYMVATMRRADEKINATRDAAVQAAGKNFEVIRVSRVIYEPPVYEVLLRMDTGEEGIVKLDAPQLTSERLFRQKCVGDINFLPQMKDAHSGKGYDGFIQAVLAMAVVETPPKDATDTGYLTGRILDILKHELALERPDDPAESLLGWRNEQDAAAFVRGQALMQRLSQQMVRSAPAPGKVWEALRAIGGTEASWRDPESKKTVRMWRVPLGPVDAHT